MCALAAALVASPLFADAALVEPWRSMDVTLHSGAKLHMEMDKLKLGRVWVRVDSCTAELPASYRNLDVRPGLDARPGLDSAQLISNVDAQGPFNILALEVVFAESPDLRVQSQGRVDWYLRNCKFYKRDVFKEVGGVEQQIASD